MPIQSSQVRFTWPFRRTDFPTFLGLNGIFLIGFIYRACVANVEPLEAPVFLYPWFEYAREHGISSLSEPFTNYTPFYTYLLIAVSTAPTNIAPIILIKSISFIFEILTAILGYRMAKGGRAGLCAFGGLWLAPTILVNGPMWGQADSIWGYFCLYSLHFFLKLRNGTIFFGAAVAVKAQAAFLGPFVLGMLLRRKGGWLWLLTVPAVYLGFALPALSAGRPLSEVLTIYVDQAYYYDQLMMNAANLWVFLPLKYEFGVVIGLVLASSAGIALSAYIRRSPRNDSEFMLVSGCISLGLMPFLLPKMHERYFYAFEMAVIVLASMHPRYVWAAVCAQLSGVSAYLAWGVTDKALVPGALLNAILLAALCFALVRASEPERASGQPERQL